jgi:hypothetical protein
MEHVVSLISKKSILNIHNVNYKYNKFDKGNLVGKIQ